MVSVHQKLRRVGSVVVLAITAAATVAAFTGYSSNESDHARFSPVADTSNLSGDASYSDSKLPSYGDQKDSDLPSYPAIELPSYPTEPQPSYPTEPQPFYPSVELPSYPTME